MKFSGIDLHSNNSVVVVSDEEDRIVYQKRLPNNLEQIRAALAPYRDELAGVVVESTYNWYFLVDGLTKRFSDGSANVHRHANWQSPRRAVRRRGAAGGAGVADRRIDTRFRRCKPPIS
jgi:hypothetical protein